MVDKNNDQIFNQSTLNYWLEEGVYGFKIVATDHLFEDADFKNEVNKLPWS